MTANNDKQLQAAIEKARECAAIQPNFIDSKILFRGMKVEQVREFCFETEVRPLLQNKDAENFVKAKVQEKVR